jgi:hypothetical protein
MNVKPVDFKENQFKFKMYQGIIAFYYPFDRSMEVKYGIGQMLPVQCMLLIHPSI